MIFDIEEIVTGSSMMKFKIFVALLSATFSLSISNSVFADNHMVMAGKIHINDPTIRATPPNPSVTAGYIVLHNAGEEAERLVGAVSQIAKKTEIHETKMDADVMKMRHLKQGLEIPAGATVMLEPGGRHLMFIKLSGQLNEGETHKVTLQFEKAGEVEIDFMVKNLRGGSKKKHQTKMNRSEMDHSKHEENN